MQLKVGDKIKVIKQIRETNTVFRAKRVGTIIGIGSVFVLIDWHSPVRRAYNTQYRSDVGYAIGHDGFGVFPNKASEGHGWFLTKRQVLLHCEVVL